MRQQMSTTTLVHLDHRELLLMRTAMAVTIYAANPQRTVQIVLRRHACIADVILGFDVDACQLAYDGSAVYATRAAVRAFRTGVNLADPERSSPAYEKRLAKYAARGFAVAVPGLELERVAPRFTSGTFTYVGSSLRSLALTFGGADQPTYAVGQHEVEGLPKLLVLANLRSVVRRGDPFLGRVELSGDGSGTFLVDIERLAEYGKRSDEVWRRATPPSLPPMKVLLGKRLTRTELLQDDDYANTGVLLPYDERIEWPSELLPSLAASDRNPPKSEDGSVSFVYHLLSVPEGAGAAEAPVALGPIEDAAALFPSAYEGGRDAKLPRSLRFPASNATGSVNPFARLPAEQWFGEVFEKGEA
jgi:hypothetical protein